MRAVKSKDTAPEMTVRRLAHRMGYRFRLHRKDLPGKPDVVFPRLHKALFVHGCFWHGHNCPRGSRVPKTNADYWTKKISRNRTRDDKAQRSLKALGWRVFVVWECELSDIEKAARSIKAILKAA
jgi:DNA mismatch endonuclease (patch repair protein)